MIARCSVCVSGFVFALLACGGSDGAPIGSGSAPAAEGGLAPSPSDDGGAADAPPPFTCDADPALDARVVTEECGVFVSPPRLGGGDARLGTRAEPLATLSHGLDAAQQLGRRWVFLCASELTENVVMRTEHAGVRVYGGLACPDETAPWTTVAGRRARVKQPADTAPNVPVWRVEGIGLPVVLEAIEVVANDGTAPSASSIALSVKGVPSLELRNVRLVAGKGADGAAGATGVEGEWVQATFIPQLDAYGALNGAAGGRSQEFDCNTGGHTHGGSGGTASEGSSPSQDGRVGVPFLQGGLGGTSAACLASGTEGKNGSKGGAGSPGRGAAVAGTLSPEGWHPSAGSLGTNGSPGQGGGGGGAGKYTIDSVGHTLGGGGAGGAGSCGGGGGAGGAGGGASLAVLAIDAQVTAIGTELVTGAGGTGGAGGDGRIAWADGSGLGYFGSRPSGTGCWGGAGGAGGQGGAGGGGAGGISVGVLMNGASVATLDGATRSASTLGGVGAGGAGADTDGRGLMGAAQLVLTTR